MSLIKVDSLADTSRRRERMLKLAENDMQEAIGKATRRFLTRMLDRVNGELTASLVAGPMPFATSSLFTLGELQGWWADEVDSNVTAAVERAWRLGHFDTSDSPLASSSLARSGDHLARVTDRLSRTATPTLPEAAFDRVRTSLADEIGRGSTTREMTQRLGAELNWQGEQVGFWRERLGEADGQIDRILDPLGPPGTPTREAARLNDPRVRELQARRSDMVTRLDRDASVWENRAERIARTESTGAYNAGALDAGHEERAGVKVWVATADDRTRETHLEISGTCVGIDDSFTVGGYELQMPADPSAPPEETVNCRCTIVFDSSCEAAAGLTSEADKVIDEERERRDVDAAEQQPTIVGPEGSQRIGLSDEGVTDTRALHGQMTDGQFRYSPERIEQVHNVYVGQQIRQAIPVERPTATIMGGGPASGKSTVINSGDVKLPNSHVVANADDAKEAIPEYRAGVAAKDPNAAAFAHEESSDMAKRLMRESLDGSHNTVLDGTGDGSIDGLTRKITSAREHGATRIVGEYVTVDTDEAVRRSAARAAQTGRGVPEEVIRGTHAAVSDVFPKAAARDLFDELRLYDTSGSAPALIYEKVSGVERIIDADAWQRFLAKANP